MSNLREAAQQALDALESGPAAHVKWVITALRAALAEFNPDWDQIEPLQENLREHMAEIQRLRAALAEPVQEPVAWMVYTLDGKSVCVTDNPADFIEWRSLPLYTAPPQRKPLRTVIYACPICAASLERQE